MTIAGEEVAVKLQYPGLESQVCRCVGVSSRFSLPADGMGLHGLESYTAEFRVNGSK